jgi:protein gp37
MGVAKYANSFKVTIHEKSLIEPVKWRKPRKIFVCSMSDLFHEEVPFAFVEKVMAIIEKTPQHSYQILTKRAERMAEYFKTNDIPANVWLGVTVDVAQCKERIEYLRKVQGANIKFLSCEPLLEDLGPLNLDGIDWIIVGGESGNQARQMKKEWAISIKEQCDTAGKSFFFKQWGTWGADGIKRSKGKNGKELNGEILHSMPASK